MNIDMTLSQIGDGDREIIKRLMTRLTMAKVLKMMGHDIQNFIFLKQEFNKYSYYPIQTVMNDFLEFLDAAKANYIWDEEEYTLTLYFDSKVKQLEQLAESITYGWDDIEEYGELELEEVVEYFEHGLRFNLQEYDGTPLMFFREYYELLKENKLI